MSKITPVFTICTPLLCLLFPYQSLGSDAATNTSPKPKHSLQDFSMLGIKAGDDLDAVLRNPAVIAGEKRDCFFQKKVAPFVVPQDPLAAALKWQNPLGFGPFDVYQFHGSTNGVVDTIQWVYPDKTRAPKLLGAPVTAFKVWGRVDPSDNRWKVVEMNCHIAGVDAGAFQQALRDQFGFQGKSMRDEQANILGASDCLQSYDFLGTGVFPGVQISFLAQGLKEKYEKALKDFVAARRADEEKKSKEGLLQPSGILQ